MKNLIFIGIVSVAGIAQALQVEYVTYTDASGIVSSSPEITVTPVPAQREYSVQVAANKKILSATVTPIDRDGATFATLKQFVQPQAFSFSLTTMKLSSNYTYVYKDKDPQGFTATIITENIP